MRGSRVRIHETVEAFRIIWETVIASELAC